MFSPLLENLIKTLQHLPTIGQKSAQRLAFFLLDNEKNKSVARELSLAIDSAIHHIGYCQKCRNYSETEICGICGDARRNQETLCIVESPIDVIAIEKSGAYRGHYFVLRGRLSPLDGIGPKDIGLDVLEKRLKAITSEVKEVIIATNHTAEGEATAHYIYELINSLPIKVSRIAYGVPLGGELEYVDSRTLAEALNYRIDVLKGEKS